MNSGISLLMLGILFGLLLLSHLIVCQECIPANKLYLESSAPSLRFTRIPTDDVIHSGENVTLICISSLSKFDYGSRINAQPFWMQIIHGRHIVRKCGGRSADRADQMTCSLAIGNVNASHMGDWFCRAENAMACTFSFLTLKIKAHWKPVIRFHPQNITVHAGEKVTFFCKATGFPPPVIRWLINDLPVKNAKVVQNGSLSTLILHSVSEEESGNKYRCLANNSVGGTFSMEATLRIFLPAAFKVSWKPVFLSHPQNVSVDRGDNVSFFCEATGFPPPAIGWLKNNLPITKATVIQNGSFSFLVLRSVNEEESGDKYQCFAKNSAGVSFSKKAAFMIISPTEISVSDSKQTAVSHTVQTTGLICLGAVLAFLLALATVVVVFIKLKGRCKKTITSEGTTSDEQMLVGESLT